MIQCVLQYFHVHNIDGQWHWSDFSIGLVIKNISTTSIFFILTYLAKIAVYNGIVEITNEVDSPVARHESALFFIFEVL